MRAKELVWATALKPWTHHPFWASVMQCFNELLRAFVKSREPKEKMKRILKARLEKLGQGVRMAPLLISSRLLPTLGMLLTLRVFCTPLAKPAYLYLTRTPDGSPRKSNKPLS